MPNVLRVALPGYNALTDTNLDHFALYSDQDNVLIKEYARGSFSLVDGATETITHNFGYIPFFIVYQNNGVVDLLLVGKGAFQSSVVYSTTTEIKIVNNTGGSRIYKYYIFYDSF